MSYLTAAQYARNAGLAAGIAKSHFTDYEHTKLAEAIELLSKAVEEMARSANRAAD